MGIYHDARYPLILLVTADDMFSGDYRARLQDLLYGASESESEVRKGTHDFWITYAVEPQAVSDWAFEDLSTTPRRMRGIIRMQSIPPNTLEDTVRSHLSVMLQEVGHHWLVPSDLAFNVNGALQSMPSDVANTQSINSEQPFSGPPLLARAGIHWSAYFQADGSPLDGLYLVPQRVEDGYAVWRARDFAGPTLSPSGLPPVHMRTSYNDLDRIVMGLKVASTAYASTNGTFRWIEPRLSAPHPYHAGIFVAFSKFDFIYFGFFEDQRILVVQRTGQSAVTAALGSGFRPLAHDFNAVALRIVRRHNSYYFQARYDYPPQPSSFSAPAPAPRLDDGLALLPAVVPNPIFNESKFQTVARLDVADVPRAVGVLVKKWDHPHMADLAFGPVIINERGATRTFDTKVAPATFASNGDYSTLRADELRVQIPKTGPIIRARSGRLHIIAPFHTVQNGMLVEHDGFDHSATIDHAPKVLTRAPSGDFAFAAAAKMWRVIYTPWAGGYVRERTVWGLEKFLPASSVVVPGRLATNRAAPPGKTYRVAFIIVARDRTDINAAMLDRVDAVRRYWDLLFDAAVEHRRHSDSGTLSFTPSELRFGSVTLGYSRRMTFTIRNNEPVDVAIQIAASQGAPFRWNAVNEVLPSRQDTVISVDFAPISGGLVQRTIQIQANPPGSIYLFLVKGTCVVPPNIP